MTSQIFRFRIHKISFICSLALVSIVMDVSGATRGQAAIPRRIALPSISSVDEWCMHLSKELQSVDLNRCKAKQWITDGKSKSNILIPHLFWGSESGRHVMIVGGIHGDEISSVSLVFRWMDFLETVRADSPLRKMRFVFLPLTNPDGFWSTPRTRTNVAGVDLNRNFNTKGWEGEALHYWQAKTRKDPRRFPGTGAGSEVETRFLQKQVDEFKPEIIVSVHAPYGILDHDGPVSFPKNLKSPLPVKVLGAFPGSLGRFAGIDRNVPVITVELMMAKLLPDPRAIEELFLFVLQSKAQGVQSVVR